MVEKSEHRCISDPSGNDFVLFEARAGVSKKCKYTQVTTAEDVNVTCCGRVVGCSR